MRSLLPFGWGTTASEPAPFGTLQREIDRVFNDFARRFGEPPAAGDLTPKLDVAETESEIKVTAELPGVDEKDVEVTVRDDVLTIRGEKKAETETKEKDYHFVERSYGSFSRSLRLPPGMDTEKVKATMEKGVLTVTLAKPALAQPKKIDIKAAA